MVCDEPPQQGMDPPVGEQLPPVSAILPYFSFTSRTRRSFASTRSVTTPSVIVPPLPSREIFHQMIERPRTAILGRAADGLE